jgi:hypothetical protein
MSDHDYYLPNQPTSCPRCRGPLAAWHGWDGPCGNVTWVQGAACAIDPFGEANTISPDQFHHFRLPEEFEAHTWCLHCWLGLVGRGSRKGDRWADWALTDDLGRIVDAVAVDSGRRQCTNCSTAWEERESVPYRTCPGCDRLTKLVVRTA